MSPRASRAQRGQALTEFTLLLPVLMLIFVGAVDVGRAFSAYVTVTNASRAGARAAIVKPARNATEIDKIKNSVIQEANGSGITIQSSNIAVDCAAATSNSFSASNCATAANGDKVRVRVTYNYQFILTQFLGIGSIAMTNNTVMSITML